MIVSPRHRFVFLKVPKTAGTSVEVFLSEACGPDAVVTPIHPPVEGHEPRNWRGLFDPLPELLRRRCQRPFRPLEDLFHRRRYYNHMPAVAVRNRLPRRLWEESLVWCVERNPWDKVVSHFWMERERGEPDLEFDEYLDRGDFPRASCLYTDHDGSVLADRILRWERLEEELADLMSELGVPFDGLEARAKSGHRPADRSYRDHYDRRGREIVARAYRRQIELTGYEF